MKQSDFDALKEALKSGDNEVLGFIFSEHSAFCVNNLRKKTNCPEDQLEDVFIEAVMSFREHVIDGRLENVKNLRGYLSRTCYNMWLTEYDRQKKWNKSMKDIERFFYGSSAISKLTESDSPEFDQSRLNALRSCWSLLESKCQDIIYYFYVDKIRMKEIADLMGLANADVAKTTKMRCFKKLMSLVKDESEVS